MWFAIIFFAILIMIKAKDKRTVKFFFAILFIVTMVIIILLITNYKLLWFTFLRLFTNDSESVHQRYDAWYLSIRDFVSRPIFGLGYHISSTTGELYMNYKPRYFELEDSGGAPGSFLGILSQNGIITLIPYLLLILKSIFPVKSNGDTKNKNKVNALKFAMWINFIGAQQYTNYKTYSFWLLIGIISGLEFCFLRSKKIIRNNFCTVNKVFIFRSICQIFYLFL